VKNSIVSLLVAGALLAGCSSSGSTASPSTTVQQPATSTTTAHATTGATDVKTAVKATGTITTGSLVTADKRTRTYRVYVPSGLPTTKVPLLVALHGGTGWGAQFELNSGFDGLAQANGFIVVYPDGVGTGAKADVNRTWNGGGCCGVAQRDKVDDVGFVRALIDQLEAKYAIDPARVFATGHSNGGILAYRLACELSDRIAAVALQSGTMEISSCAPSKPVSLLHIHGTADTNVPIDGGKGSTSIANVPFASPRTSIATFATSDGCDAPVQKVDPANKDLTATTWTGCPKGIDVKFIAVTGGTHPWMGHKPLNPKAPTPYLKLDSSLTIVSFLLRHPRPAAQ
jgi:polyhydroxybutyrate depolymerase